MFEWTPKTKKEKGYSRENVKIIENQQFFSIIPAVVLV